MEDLLYTAAYEYKRMHNIAYEIVLGRKGKKYTLFLHFPPETFFHLIGLQHLTDITFPSTNKERILKEILKKNLTYSSLQKSVFFEENFIEERISNLHLLEEMLDSNTVTYLINPKEYQKYSNIKADYVFEYINLELQIFYFFVIIEKKFPHFTNECRGCSFFKKHKVDYTKGTARTTVLMITKFIRFNTIQQIKEIKYKNPTYRE